MTEGLLSRKVSLEKLNDLQVHGEVGGGKGVVCPSHIPPLLSAANLWCVTGALATATWDSNFILLIHF